MYKLKRILRKLYYILAFLGIQILFCIPVFADDKPGSAWIGWKSHIYTAWENWLFAYDVNPNDSNLPWWVVYQNDNTKGVWIDYHFVNPYADIDYFYYFQLDNPTLHGYFGGDYHNTVVKQEAPPTSEYQTITMSNFLTANVSDDDFLQSIKNSFDFGEHEVYYYSFGPLQHSYFGENSVNNADIICTSFSDLNSQLNDVGYNPPPEPVEGLPMLNCQLESKTAVKFPYGFFVKHVLNWELDQSPYSTNSSNYYVEILASANVNSAGVIDKDNMTFNSGHNVTITDGGCNLGLKTYSWDHSEIGKKLYQTYGFNEYPPHNNANMNLAAGYFIYVRVVSQDGTQYSPYKIYYTTGNGVWDKTGYKIDDKDSEPTPITDSEQDSDSGGSDPFPSYTNDSSTSAQSDPSSADYNGGNYNPSQVLNNLKAIVNSLGELPALVAQIFTFFPSWLITLMIASIGMIIIIGTVKLILR